MTEEPHPLNAETTDEKERQLLLPEEARIREILERARQNVKRVAQREREGEKITREVLNFRLRAGDNA